MSFIGKHKGNIAISHAYHKIPLVAEKGWTEPQHRGINLSLNCALGYVYNTELILERCLHSASMDVEASTAPSPYRSRSRSNNSQICLQFFHNMYLLSSGHELLYHSRQKLILLSDEAAEDARVGCLCTSSWRKNHSRKDFCQYSN